MKVLTPTLGGVVGIAQLATAGSLLLRSDFSLLHWALSVPIGALLGATLGWALLRLRGRLNAWREWGTACGFATLCGFPVALIAPSTLGLAPQTSFQLWSSFALLYCVAWSCLFVTAQLERRHFL